MLLYLLSLKYVCCEKKTKTVTICEHWKLLQMIIHKANVETIIYIFTKSPIISYLITYLIMHLSFTYIINYCKY